MNTKANPPRTIEPDQLALIESRLDSLQAIQAQLTTLLERVNESSVMVDKLWTLDDIGNYMGVSSMTARRVMAQRGAPMPVRVATSKKTKTHPRWVPAEVIKFILARKHRAEHVITY